MVPSGAAITVMLAVAPLTLGMPALAVILTGPPTETPVTGTGTLEAPAAIVTFDGTLATPDALEVRLMVRAVGVGADRFSVRFCVAPTVIVRLDGEKLSAPFT